MRACTVGSSISPCYRDTPSRHRHAQPMYAYAAARTEQRCVDDRSVVLWLHARSSACVVTSVACSGASEAAWVAGRVLLLCRAAPRAASDRAGAAV